VQIPSTKSKVGGAITNGDVKTPLTAKSLGNKAIVDEWMYMTPMGRPCEPNELKGIALFLASKASSFVTGSVILIDGGYTCL